MYLTFCFYICVQSRMLNVPAVERRPWDGGQTDLGDAVVLVWTTLLLLLALSLMLLLLAVGWNIDIKVASKINSGNFPPSVARPTDTIIGP